MATNEQLWLFGRAIVTLVFGKEIVMHECMESAVYNKGSVFYGDTNKTMASEKKSFHKHKPLYIHCKSYLSEDCFQGKQQVAVQSANEYEQARILVGCVLSA
jgi:hypothetical protein